MRISGVVLNPENMRDPIEKMAGVQEAEICLRVVRLVPEEGKQNPPSTGLFYSLSGGFNGYEHGIDLRQNLRIIKRQSPTSVLGVIIVEYTQASDRLFGAEAFSYREYSRISQRSNNRRVQFRYRRSACDQERFQFGCAPFRNIKGHNAA